MIPLLCFIIQLISKKLIEEIMSHVIEHLRIIVIRFMEIAQ